MGKSMYRTGLLLNLTNFKGKIFFVSNLQGRISTLRTLLSKVTFENDPFVLISTGNTFDYGPESLETIRAINNQLGSSVVRVVCCIGQQELRMLRAMNEIEVGSHTFVHDTWLRQQWRSHGGEWHDNVNRYELNDELTKFKKNNSALFIELLLPDEQVSCVVHAELPKTDTYFKQFSRRFMDMEYSKVKAYLNTFINSDSNLKGTSHQYKDLLFTYCGRPSADSVRSYYSLTAGPGPVQIGNQIFGVSNDKNRGLSRDLSIDEYVLVPNRKGYWLKHRISCVMGRYELYTSNNIELGNTQ